jgi:hypothetical protein
MNWFDEVVDAVTIYDIKDNVRILAAAKEVNMQYKIVDLSARKYTYQCLWVWNIQYVWANWWIIWFWNAWWLFEAIQHIADEIIWLQDEITLEIIQQYKDKQNTV